MPLIRQPDDETADDDTTIDECIEELDELVLSLDRYPPTTVAIAIGAYLEGLLGALLDEQLCTSEEIRGLLQGIETGVLDEQRDAGR